MANFTVQSSFFFNFEICKIHSNRNESKTNNIAPFYSLHKRVEVWVSRDLFLNGPEELSGGEGAKKKKAAAAKKKKKFRFHGQKILFISPLLG